MKTEKKLSHQGLRDVKPQIAEDMKNNFIQEITLTSPLKREGYFIGKAQLMKMLIEYEDAAGILISFGLNASIGTTGQLQLIFEPASGKKDKDDPKIIQNLTKYATINVLNTGGPEDALPMIKPKPPQG